VKRIGLFGIGAAVLAMLALAGYSVSGKVSGCVARARAVLEGADAADRSPPAPVVRIVEAEVGRTRIADMLSSVLLDRLRCAGESGTDWLIERPALAWALDRSFSEAELIGLFASTVDSGAGALGLSAGARTYYAKELPDTGEEVVSCLVQKALGALHMPCGREAFPARPIID